MAIASLVMTNT